MSYRRFLVLLTAGALAPLAHAGQTYSAENLGAAFGVLDYCSRVDPGSEHRFDAKAARLAADVGGDELKRIRAASAYQGAYQEIEAVLASIPLDEGRRQCDAIQSAESRAGEHHDGAHDGNDDRSDH